MSEIYGMRVLLKLGILVRKIGLEVGLIVIVFIGFRVYERAREFEDVSGWLQHANVVLTDIYNIMTLFERAETSQRDFLISRNPEFKRNYEKAMTHLQSEVVKIQSMVKEDSAQYGRAHQLNSLLDDLSESLSSKSQKKYLKPSDPDFLNRRLVEQIRFLTHDMAYAERKLIIVRAERAQDAAHQIALLILTGGMIACFFLLASRIIIRADYNKIRSKDRNLEQRTLLLNSVIDNMSEGLIMADETGELILANPAARKILGDQVLKISMNDRPQKLGIFQPNSNEYFPWKELPLVKALDGIATDNVEMKIVNSNYPEGLMVNISGRPLVSDAAGIQGGIAVVRDISKQKALEEEWRRAREAAIEGSRMKSDFLASISHEIRTPMNGIIGMSTLLMDTKLHPEQVDFVNTIRKSAESLVSLINSILDHSKIEAKKVSLETVNFDVKELLSDVVEIFRFMASEKKLKIFYRVSDDVHFAAGDVGRIRQILMNLVGNAVKFTSKGSVEISVQNVSTTEGALKLRFEVKDSGIGISKEDKCALFQRYGQTAVGSRYGGSGLGLLISSQLVELMNGAIGVESELGVGSTFWFEVALRPALRVETTKASKLQDPQRKFSGLVLVVEDQVINQRVVAKYLEKMGLAVDLAENGEVALKLCEQQAYDMIFMDCQMPVLNGYLTTETLRENEKTARVPIVALTAQGYSDDRERCFESGMDDFLAKPIDYGALLSMVERWLPQWEGEINVSVLYRLLENSDLDLLAKLIKDFQTAVPPQIQNMQDAVHKGDLATLQQIAHSLKSNSATLGALNMSELCASLEKTSELTSSSLDEVSQLSALYGQAASDLGEIYSKLQRKQAS